MEMAMSVVRYGVKLGGESVQNIKLDVVERPRIRDDGFHGGRCEPVKLIYDFKSKGVKKYIV